ncbi:MAG: hypothetical protein PVH88_18560 [Ignavibacteria bacterium]|jgi:hypothetical protein
MENFNANQVQRTYKIELNGTIEKVFPLFTPIEEKKWAEGWEPQVIYPLEEEIKAEMIFRSKHIDEYPTYWVIADYKPEEHFIRYINFTYDYRVVMLKIKCNKIPNGKTEAVINYTFTGLSEKGNKYVESITESHYKEYISSWQTDIHKPK